MLLLSAFLILFPTARFSFWLQPHSLGLQSHSSQQAIASLLLSPLKCSQSIQQHFRLEPLSVAIPYFIPIILLSFPLLFTNLSRKILALPLLPYFIFPLDYFHFQHCRLL